MTLSTHILLVLLLAAAVGISCLADTGNGGYLWTMNSEKELIEYGNDQTGARLELGSRVSSLGAHSFKVILTTGDGRRRATRSNRLTSSLCAVNRLPVNGDGELTRKSSEKVYIH